MTKPVLYSFRRCPFAIRARMAIAAAGAPAAVRLREILLRDKPEEMLAASPKGTVPVLVQPGGEVLEQSLDIMLWALGLADPMKWLDCDLDAAFALIADCDGPFKVNLDRYKYSTRYPGEHGDDHRDAGAAYLRNWSERIARHGGLMSDRPTLADIAIFPFVRQFRSADPDWFDAQGWPPLSDWLETGLADPIFETVMSKTPPWRETGVERPFPPLAA